METPSESEGTKADILTSIKVGINSYFEDFSNPENYVETMYAERSRIVFKDVLFFAFSTFTFRLGRALRCEVDTDDTLSAEIKTAKSQRRNNLGNALSFASWYTITGCIIGTTIPPIFGLEKLNIFDQPNLKSSLQKCTSIFLISTIPSFGLSVHELLHHLTGFNLTAIPLPSIDLTNFRNIFGREDEFEEVSLE